MNVRISRWGAPATYITAVVLIGLTLITIIVRSPDTHSNYQGVPEAYSRTKLASIGEEEPFDGFARNLGTPPKAILVRAGCASCHGLSGEGGVVGPPIWQKSAEDLLEAVRGGKPGMPLFPPEWLSDDDVVALAAYLNGLREAAGSAP